MRNAVKMDRGLWAPLAGAFLATLALCIACIAGVLMGNVSSAQADDESSTLSSSSTTKIVIKNVEDGATVTAYRVIEVNIDDGTPADPVYYWEDEVDEAASSDAMSVAQWVKENYESYVGANVGSDSTGDDLGTDAKNDGVAVNSAAIEEASASDLAGFYDALAAAIRSGTVSLPTENIYQGTTDDTTVTTVTIEDVTMGGYFVLVSGGSYVYLPATVNVVPTYDKETSSWVLADSYEDYAKRSKSDDNGDGVPDDEGDEDNDGAIDSNGDQMTITKTVTDGDGEETATTVAIGDTLTYSLTATVPSYPANALKRWFSVSDILNEELTLDEDSITVYGVDSKGEKSKLTAGTHYTLTVTEDANGDGDYEDEGEAKATCVDENGTTVTATFTVLFDDEETTDENGDTTSQYDSVKTYAYIYITYNVTVSEDVQPGSSYSNYAHLNYFSDPYSTEDTPDEVNPGDSEVTGGDEDDGNGDGGDDGNDGVDVYTYGINLSKVDSISTTTLLAGAEFTLADSDGSTLHFVKIADGVYRLATSTTADNAVTYEDGATTTLVVGSEDSETETNGFKSKEGVLVVYGLDVGTYSLTETAAPAGYAKLGSSIKVTIADDDVNGQPTLSGKYTDTTEASDGYVKFSVKNSNASVFSLPSTGGPGTLILTIAGIVLIAAAIALCVSRKKKGTRA